MVVIWRHRLTSPGPISIIKSKSSSSVSPTNRKIKFYYKVVLTMLIVGDNKRWVR